MRAKKNGLFVSPKIIFYDIETVCASSGNRCHVKRRFHDFYLIRKHLLQDSSCPQCPSCLGYIRELKAIHFPSRFGHLAFFSKRLLIRERQTRLLVFVAELVKLTATVGKKCRMNGAYVCKTLGRFLGFKSTLLTMYFSLRFTRIQAMDSSVQRQVITTEAGARQPRQRRYSTEEHTASLILEHSQQQQQQPFTRHHWSV